MSTRFFMLCILVISQASLPPENQPKLKLGNLEETSGAIPANYNPSDTKIFPLVVFPNKLSAKAADRTAHVHRLSRFNAACKTYRLQK